MAQAFPIRVPNLPAIDQRMDDVRAVMDAVKIERAHQFGISEGGSIEFFILGVAVAGGGCGLAFSGLVQLPAPLADPHERAELFVAIFVATYLSLSLPPIAVGFLIPVFGLFAAIQSYLSILLIVALFALFFANQSR